jgi:hypothetical protein
LTFWVDVKRWQKAVWGEVPDQMRRGVFRVRSLETDVLGVIVADNSVTRCISIADASLSLSLSLLEGSSRPKR